MSQERYEAGLAVRREVLGNEYVDQKILLKASKK